MGEMQRMAAQRSAEALAPRRHTDAVRARPAGPTTLIATPGVQSASFSVLQPKLMVGVANDPFEREADRTADQVMANGSAPRIGVGGIAASLMRLVRRALGKTEPPVKKDDEDKKKMVQKDSTGAGPATVPAGIEASIEAMSAGGGSPLSPELRALFEPRFGYDFGDVRVHAGPAAAGAAQALGARAFTVGRDVFFGAGEYQPTSTQGQRLVAHELTHTIQQAPAATRASRMISGAPAPVRAAPKRVQRLFDDVKASIRNKVRDFITRDFPPWDLITLIIGWDPIQEKSVKGSTRDWIRAAMKLAPDGEALFARLDQEGKIDAVAKWWDAEIAKLDLSYAGMVALANKAWDAVGASDIFSPLAAWNEKIKPIFMPTINRVWDFIKAVGAKILSVVKDLVLGSISAWAQQQKGYTLLTFVLGNDPVTGQEVKRTVKGLIFAVLDLVPGGEQIKENLEKSKTIEKASAWFSQEVKTLDLTWEGIKALFKQAWDAFKVSDLLNPKLLFEKMAGIFGPPLLRLLNFLIAVGKKVLEFIFEGAMMIAGPIGQQIAAIFRKIGDTFNKIVADPVAFVGHLVDAVKKGIQQFAKNILDHLKTGLIEWLVGTLEGAGLVLPKVWDLKGILDLVLQILGITYAKIRAKLVKVLGEKTVSMLETAFAFIKTLVTEGPAAAWKQIVEAIGSLWDMVIGGIKDWAVTKIVTAAITKLVTMFNPAGAIIQAIIATYNTVAFFIERIKQILAFVEAVVDSIANIANGKIAQAANYVERAMARTIPVILGFLARLIGLGNVSEAVKKVITAIHAKVDKGIDAVIKWVMDKAKSLFGKGGDDKGDRKDSVPMPDVTVQKPFKMAKAGHSLTLTVKGGQMQLTMASSVAGVLHDLAQAAFDQANDPKQTPTLKEDERRFLRKTLLDLRDEAKIENINSAYTHAGRPPGADQWLSQYITNMIEHDLLPLGAFGLSSLTGFVKQVPPVRFLPTSYQDGDFIRYQLYVSKSDWDTIKEKDDPVERRAIADAVEAAHAAKDQAAWSRLKTAPAPDGRAGYLIPSTAELGKYRRGDVNMQKMARDHVIPLAQHWTQSGYNQTDTERTAVGKGTGGGQRLELITVEYNSRKQSLGHKYRFDVHSTFASDKCESPVMSWRIKGQPFLRTKDGPSVAEQTGT